MPSIVRPLDSRGRPMLEVEAAVPATRARSLRHAGLAVPGPLFPLSGLVDTGASISCIDTRACQLLNLTPFSTRVINTPASGPNPPLALLFKVSLTIPHPGGNPSLHLVRPSFDVAAANLGPLRTDVLLGRDLLAGCRFVYDAQAGTCSLDF